jgi:protease I
VAILASNGVEESEITFPYEYLKNLGAKVEIIVPSWTKEGIVASKYLKPTLWVKADATFTEATVRKYDLLVLTGGAWNSQVVRSDAEALRLIKQHYQNKGPIAAICAGSIVLVDAGLSKNQTMTGSPIVRIDLENSGAHYLDQPLVISENIATSRSPNDLEYFVTGIKTLLINNEQR